MIWTHNWSLAGKQGISSPVSLLPDLLVGLFSHLRDTTVYTGFIVSIYTLPPWIFFSLLFLPFPLISFFSLVLSSVFPLSFWNYCNNSAPPQPKKSRWWSWIIAIIQKKGGKKEEGKRKGRRGGIEGDALHASRVPCVCGTCAPVTRAQRTDDAIVTLARRTEASLKNKNWQNDKTSSDCLVQVLMFGRVNSTVSRIMIQTWEVEWPRSWTSKLCHHYNFYRNSNVFL